MVALVEQDQASTRVIPLSTMARQLTQFLFDGTPLPHLLERYGHLILAFTGGAVVGCSIYHFFQKHKQNRAKIQLAVFHIVRMVENIPDLQVRLEEPQKFIKQMATEMARMTNLHLTKSEADRAMLQLKRKVWTVVDEKIKVEKRRRIGDATAEIAITKHFARPLEDPIPVLHQGDVPRIIVTSPTTEDDVQAQLLEEDEVPDVEMLDIDDQKLVEETTPLQHHTPSVSPSQASLQLQIQARSPYTSSYQKPPLTYRAYKHIPSSDSEHSPSTPTPAPRPKHSSSHAAKAGHGLSYDDNGLVSSSSPPSTRMSSTEKPRSQRQQFPVVSKKPISMLQAATLRAFHPNAPGNRSYESPVLPRAKNTMVMSTNKIQGSQIDSATKIFRKETNMPFSSIHKHRMKTSNAQHDQIHRSKPIGLEKMMLDKDWPPPFIPSSDGWNNSRSSAPSPEQSRFPPIPPIDGAPSAPPISPLSHSPTRAVQKPDVSSLIQDPIPASPSVEAQTPVIAISSPALQSVHPELPQTPTPARTPQRTSTSSSPVVLVNVSPNSSTSSSVKRKRGRPKKVVGQLQTPRKVQTPATRRSARQLASKGM
ncbi:Nn.00g074910.m01.CDS01 [Neocucurbitaria sp. VM-36]